MFEAAFVLAFLVCLLMAARAWRLNRREDNSVDELVGRRVLAIVGAGELAGGVEALAVLEEVNGDSLRFTWLEPRINLPPVNEEGWIHRGRVTKLVPEAAWSA